MKISKLWLLSNFVAIFSITLSACAQPALPATVATQTSQPTTMVTETPSQPKVTESPAPVTNVDVDFQQLFKGVIADMPTEKGYSTVNPTALSQEMASKPPFLLDVRQAAEVEKSGYIKGAVNIPIRDLLKNLDKLPKPDDPIVVYCSSGHRSSLALTALKMLGYSNVRNLAGGLLAWKSVKLPLETGPKPTEIKSLVTPQIKDAAVLGSLDHFLSGMPDGFYTITSTDLNKALTSKTPPFLLDVRTKEEYKKDGYLEGAVNIPFLEVMDQLDTLPTKDQPIVVYCTTDHRGAVVMMALRIMGYQNVTNLVGGLNAWKTADLPVVGWVKWYKVWSDYLTSMPQSYYTITPDALNVALAETQSPFLVDVREPSEVKKDGYIKGAVNIPVHELLKNLDKLPDQSKKIVVYCDTGYRGSIAMTALQMLGYRDITNLVGGLSAWKKARLPIGMGKPEAPKAGQAPEVDATRLETLNSFLSQLPDDLYTMKTTDLKAALSSKNPPIVVDVRTAKEFAEGHIDKSIPIVLNDLMAKIGQLTPYRGTSIVVVDDSGHRGAIAMTFLRMMGYSKTRSLAGGLDAWSAAHLPLVK